MDESRELRLDFQKLMLDLDIEKFVAAGSLADFMRAVDSKG